MSSTVYHLPSTPPLVVVVGETGSGKSSLGLQLAQQFRGEIISADSWAVYRGFDIGTAKPTKRQQADVPHHLIDVVEAPDGFNAAQYKQLAVEAMDDIHARNKVPIMVGGTGLYIDSVIFDYGFLPVGDSALRAERNGRSLTELVDEALSLGIDLSGIDTRNKRRIIRALEARGQQPARQALRSNTLLLGMAVRRDILRQKVTERVDNMIEQGLEDEVQTLAQQYGWEVEPLKGIGYYEWREYFDGTQDLEQTRQRIISATLNLAKRQRTWFKRNKRIQWTDDPREAVDIVTTFLNKPE